MAPVIIRKGTESDMKAVMQLIQDLADFERASDEVNIDSNVLVQEAFGANKIIDILVAEADGDIVGTMIFYDMFSTWKGRSMYLEDFVIRKSHRRMGIGEQLFEALIAEAKRRGSAKIKWQVLDWNETAIDFYKKIDASFEQEWLNCTLNLN